MAPIQESLSGFFEALGGVMNGILDFIEPHMPMITNIIGIGINTLFSPLFLGLKALTAVLRFFAPKKNNEETTTDSTSYSSQMSYTTSYNPETGLMEVVDGTQTSDGMAVPLVSANQDNYQRQIDLLEAKKSFAIAEAKARKLENTEGHKLEIANYDKMILKYAAAYDETLEAGNIYTTANKNKQKVDG